MSLLEVDTKGAQIELLTGYSFTNKLLAAEAVQMAGPQVAVVYQSSFRRVSNNKRLSVLGDAVLTKVLCGHWFSARDRHGKELNAGDWTTLRNDMLSNESLARRGYDHGIDPFVYCNVGTVVSAKMVASTLEAIIGAVYQDGGDTAVLGVIEHLGFFGHQLLMIPATLLPRPAERGSIRPSYRKVCAIQTLVLRGVSCRKKEAARRTESSAIGVAWSLLGFGAASLPQRVLDGFGKDDHQSKEDLGIYTDYEICHL